MVRIHGGRIYYFYEGTDMLYRFNGKQIYIDLAKRYLKSGIELIDE